MYPIIVYCSFTVAALNLEPAIGRGTLVVQKSSDALTVAMFWRVTKTEERTGNTIKTATSSFTRGTNNIFANGTEKRFLVKKP